MVAFIKGGSDDVLVWYVVAVISVGFFVAEYAWGFGTPSPCDVWVLEYQSFGNELWNSSLWKSGNNYGYDVTSP